MRGWEKGWMGGGRYGCCWILWPLSVFGCISVVVVEGACVSDCTGLGLCTVGKIGLSVVGVYVGGRGSF
jgi:hypothetical protein